MQNKLAPIILFVYNRPENTKRLITSLLNNALSGASDLFIYSDAPKNQSDSKKVKDVRKFIHTIQGFKSVQIIEQSQNKGLATSIKEGVSQIINQYGKVIVLEDDLIVSDDFLEYMNDALEFYKNDNKVWSVAGYGPPLSCLKNYNKDVYLAPRASSWGWVTWKDRWNKVDWNVKDFEKVKKNKKMRKQFELGGNDIYKMLELQMLGKIDSWAVIWCFSQFMQNMYTVYPVKSKVFNAGFGDMHSTHTSGSGKKWDVNLNNEKVKPEKLEPDENIIKCFQEFYNLSLFTKIGYFLRKHGGYKIIKYIIKGLKK